MDSSVLLGVTTFAYLLAAFIYVGIFIFRKEQYGAVASTVTVLALLVNTGGIGLRWIESHQMGFGYAPLSNMYESLVFFSWSIAVFYLGLEYKYKNRFLGAFAIPFAAVAMLLAEMKNPEIRPLVPALQSNWLIAHVVTCFIGYAAFAVSSGLGVVYLLKDRKKAKAQEGKFLSLLPSLRTLDTIMHKTLVIGFIWLTAGIVTGAIWANSAWGTYWSWDPKETWSLITWFIYATALHARFTRGWGGNRIAWFAMVGFVSVMFTYYGVNYLLAGLHSYG
ncbi:cytochrome c-type biogenesis protein CcsB [Desulfocapsa sulfexigens DSM 10523]|uniref:Heme exporter protein C n=1 Tax=Desulfocapsa sulfexigens (strain DSM 10523 / SB164P1) TaxID=1167006 RepID=M1P7Y2_DESSD|nr:c-type cytochrome biogenesis protein CcsB [Desulfocapsa sulfexigens]AGF79578.1 cytochrome c-type biogenesis protein CcsB [Desulfocapsa sulfexigens DSM 10523]